MQSGAHTGWAHKGFFKRRGRAQVPLSDDGGPSLVAPRGQPRAETPPPAPQPHLEGWRRHDVAPADERASADERAADAEPGGDAPAHVEPRLTVSTRPSLPDRRTAITVGVDGGIALMSRRYVSNGAVPMAAYELSTTAAATGADASWARRIGAHGSLGADLAYVYASGGRVQYVAADGTAVKLRLQSHDVEGALRLAFYTRAAGGVELALRVGALFDVTIFDPDVTVRLQSDQLIAPVAGLTIDAAHLTTLGGHWLGVALSGRAVLAGRMAENLDEGKVRGTWGGRFGGRLTLELWRTPRRGQLLLGAGYGYAFAVTRFAGPSQRDPSATQATLGSAAHLLTLALGYAY